MVEFATVGTLLPISRAFSFGVHCATVVTVAWNRLLLTSSFVLGCCPFHVFLFAVLHGMNYWISYSLFADVLHLFLGHLRTTDVYCLVVRCNNNVRRRNKGSRKIVRTGGQRRNRIRRGGGGNIELKGGGRG